MRWGSDDVGVVLTRNEIWLLLHALADATAPAVDWEGNRVEPWVVGELRGRLQEALRPDSLSDVEERPIIRLDSEMGQSLAQAGVRPLVLSDGYDLGSLLAACAERGWGAELRLPVGAGPETPAEAVVTVGTGHSALGTGEEGAGGAFVGLERPVVALARAMIGAGEGTGHWALGTGGEGKGQRAKGKGEEGTGHSALGTGRGDGGGSDDLRSTIYDQRSAGAPLRTLDSGPRMYDEYAVPVAGVNPGEREALVEQMAGRGWELVGEDGRGLVFRKRADG